MIATKKPTLTERTYAFVRTLNAITLAADEVFVTNEPRVCAALIAAAATLVVGADLQDVALATTKEATDDR